MPDPYVLPGTAILKNKFNLITQQLVIGLGLQDERVAHERQCVSEGRAETVLRVVVGAGKEPELAGKAEVGDTRLHEILMLDPGPGADLSR